MPTNTDQPLPGETADTVAATPEQPADSKAEPPEPDEAERALVAYWTSQVRKAKSHWSAIHKRMKDDQKFASGKQWPNQQEEDPRYVANVTLRTINQKVAALYAKNPVAVAVRRKTMDFAIWDGNLDSLQPYQQALTPQQPQVDPQTGQTVMPPPPDPQMVQAAMELLADVQQGMLRRTQGERMGTTLEIVYQYQLSEQSIPFKASMKQLVRRTITTGVGFLKLGFHRFSKKLPGDVEKVTDATQPLLRAGRITDEIREGERPPEDAQADELRSMMSAAREEPSILVKEGLEFEFPASTSIIIDPRCRQLKGFLAARWVAEEYMLSVSDVKEIYGVDVSGAYTSYTNEGQSRDTQALLYGDDDKRAQGKMCAVYELYDKDTATSMTFCAGYPSWLVKPASPPLLLENFWPWFVLAFNDVEDEDCIYPPSDVKLMRDMQRDYNVSRQRLREHRDAARPKHVAPAGMLDENDKIALTGSNAHTLVELKGLPPGTSIDQVLQRVPYNPIDQALYEVNSSFEDILKTVGMQEANLGGTSGSTATESSIAEASRSTSNGSNIDDLDDFLTDVAQAASHVLLMELGVDTVKEIAGPGAVWPELSREQIAQDLTLTIKAGSSGRPNKAQEVQNFERMAPLLMQIPGVKPAWLAEQAIQRLDDRVDVTDAIASSLPSISALNGQQQQPNTTPGLNQPGMQGAQGANNAPAPPSPSNMGPGATQQTGMPPTTPGNVVQMAQGA